MSTPPGASISWSPAGGDRVSVILAEVVGSLTLAAAYPADDLRVAAIGDR
ncbi:hypothetical protein [Nannocystis punicea]|uniref:Uncharacterized protein n=1 Tax=Nannocystis punicea TaxID=2995304 RepID=A0ABY7HBI8_9BACT|nr:hypothetical protein [Nannocystis poenicansa]WAS96641.1 hypothetical protein O0S08_10845 [Nannocystis poenicansa]